MVHGYGKVSMSNESIENHISPEDDCMNRKECFEGHIILYKYIIIYILIYNELYISI